MNLHLQHSKAVQKREGELKEQLYVQAEAHAQRLSDALLNQAEQLETKWASHLETRLMQQEKYYQTEMMRTIARLRGIEQMVDIVATAGMNSRCGKLHTLENLLDPPSSNMLWTVGSVLIIEVSLLCPFSRVSTVLYFL